MKNRHPCVKTGFMVSYCQKGTVIQMLRFLLLLPIRILCLPVLLFLKLLYLLGAGILRLTGWIFVLSGTLLSALAVYGFIELSLTTGIFLTILALVFSPVGLPVLAVFLTAIPEILRIKLQSTIF